MAHNKSYVPTEQCELKIIKRELSNILDTDQYLFIDLGCGEGNVVNYFQKYFKKSIGVELDKSSAIRATQNTNGAEIINKNILDYTFENKLSVIYMFEPLWLLPPKIAISIYNKILENISSAIIDNDAYIVYLAGKNNVYIDETIFNKYEFIKITHNKMKNNRQLFIYRR